MASQRCHKLLEDKFGKESVRVALLEGQRLESERKWDEADALYKALLKEEPTSAKVMKRAAAVKIAQNVTHRHSRVAYFALPLLPDPLESRNQSL
jgi:hypothetical protein